MTVADLCALAYTMILAERTRQTELSWQVIAAAQIAAREQPDDLSTVIAKQREALNTALNAKPEDVSEDERILRAALGLKER